MNGRNLSCLLSFCGLLASASAADELKFGDYELETTVLSTETITTPLEKLRCENYQTGSPMFEFKKTQKYSSSATRSLLQAIETALVAEASLSSPVASFKQSIGLHLKAQAEADQREIEEESFTQSLKADVGRLPCFDVAVSVLHERQATKVHGMDYEWRNEVVSFKLNASSDWRFRIDATFNSECDQCERRIPSDHQRVVDTEGNGYSIEVATPNGWIYSIPLYRNDRWELANVTHFLPPEASSLLFAGDLQSWGLVSSTLDPARQPVLPDR